MGKHLKDIITFVPKTLIASFIGLYKSPILWLGRFHTLKDWTLGCIAVTNAEIEEIWELVDPGTPIDIEP